MATSSQAATRDLIFPSEVWEQVFRKLDPRHLLQVRLVCRRFNQIVTGTAALNDQLEVILKGGGNADEYECDQIKALAKCPTRFTKAKLQYVDLDNPEELLDEFLKYWAVFARSLRYLHIEGCEIPFKGLIGILRVTRNLKQLEYDVGRYLYFEPCKVDFVLNKLEVLSVTYLECNRILDTFRAICPNLRDLKMESGGYTEEFHQSTAQFVENIQGTLKHVRLENSRPLITAMTRMKRLMLDHIAFTGGDKDSFNEMVVEFSKSFASVNYLDIAAMKIRSGTTLIQLAKNMPQLRCFKVRPPNEPMSFLRHLPSLERLTVQSIEDANVCFNMGDFKSSVQHLTYRSLSFPKAVNLRNFPNIQSLSLKNCTVERSSYVILMIMQCPQLQHLSFRTLKIDQHDVSTAPSAFQGVRTNVRTFRASFENPPERLNELLTAVIRVCPLLEKIDWYISSSNMLELCREISQHCKNLQALTLHGMRLFEKDLRQLVAALHGLHLRRLDITRLDENACPEAAAEILARLGCADVSFS